MRNTKSLYWTPGFAIDCITVFFNLALKVHFNAFPKDFAFKVFINIPLKYISNNLAIIIITYDDLQNR